ncbi:hypothetical protein AcV5_004648 [Taiwanofungus camphoratus]|nr:hypothetical protein AcW2_000750 [Antrodia cinnamomea]KAI0936541.1 hypothetical protein AcV5_004648 [Antrodia cinnamomea]KAI0961755.1 hypothetical protein AcV7_000768 [Antrodia cinnamomea]
MMDRHLIYPPSWENRKRKSDWDADPSLKGKPIPIQGTTIKLDTPEAIEEWIAERKKRFPTAIRVEEKEKKLEEAIARGQLPIGDNRFPQFKRRRLSERSQGANSHYSTGTNDMNERGPRRGRGRGRGRGTDRGWQGRADRVSTMSRENAFHESPHDTVLQQPSDAPQTLTSSSTTRPSRSREQNSNFDATDSDSDSDGAPEVISSKGPSNPTEKELSQPDIQASAQASEIQATDLIQGTPTSAVQPLQPTKKSLRQPRRPPRNPFAARHSLLWNLLHPEIRTTVSNLSQAIRFLVDNDFLENVELRPGQASEKMIEVVGSSTSEDPMGISMNNMTSQVADTAPMS